MTARGSQLPLREDPGHAESVAIAHPPAAAPVFEAVFRAHSRTVGRWASRLLGPGGDCEDVVQEVFLVVRRRLPRFDGRAAITTWLYEITLRVVSDWRRRRRWWSWVTGRGQHPGRGQALSPPLSAELDPPDPVARLEGRERVLLLYRVLDGLAEVYRTTFILFELEGLSGEEIAALTGTRLATVWVRLTRARRMFIDRMRRVEAQQQETGHEKPKEKGPMPAERREGTR